MADARNTHRESETVAVRLSRSKTAYFVLIACVVPILAIAIVPVVGIAVDIYSSKRERHRLLHETDHRELLAASRKLMSDYGGQQIADPANDPRVPLIIRGLGPSYMDISAQQLRVELHGGFDHYGFIAYPEGADAGERSGQLIDGLFYYTE